ncbi:MAG: HAMP domain-containing histidine kinase [Clostridia bacterium]|nr:HAMP domain-containing histidine kinase [Clostridia bacterium]
MIQHLRRKVTCLVLAGLFVIVCLFVGSINLLNYRQLLSRADSTLELLKANQGSRPTMPLDGPQGLERTERGREASGETPPPKPEGESSPAANRPPDRMSAQPPSSRESIAGLSNFYTITLADDGTVVSWSSDREDLYTDAQVTALAQSALAGGRKQGRVGSQFYVLWATGEGEMLIVLDERLEMEAAKSLLWTTSLLGLLVYLLLAVSAFFLIKRLFVPAEEAAKKQKQFVWDASHELKTPIAVISANAEVLEREIGKNEWLGYIRSELDRTTELVQSLLELARSEQTGRQEEKQNFDLSRAVMSVALPFESTVFESGKTMVTEVEEGIRYTGIERMISQLTVILLSNAVKYAGDHGVITLSLQKKGRNRILSVHNTGSYIAPEDARRIFDRFYRVDAARSREIEGYGLGLAIAQNIAQAHGGKIQVESSIETGTRFIVTLVE